MAAFADRRPVLWLGFVLLCAVLAGCGSATATAGTSTSAGALTSSTSASSIPAPGMLRINGAVRHQETIGSGQLAALGTRTIMVSYGTHKGVSHHTETGVPLSVLLDKVGLSTDPSRKNDALTFAVLAVGADGYRAVVSYGEVAPEFGNRNILIALTQDGKKLARPRLIVPGDVKGGRYVSDLVALHIDRVTP
ncbi:MAG: hypothetical protein ACRDRL_33545 [Sciscionella sp.]